jgi:hypothetical protein
MFKVSLFASAVRKQLYPLFLNSLAGTSVPVEVIFAGHIKPDQVPKIDNVVFTYIETDYIKPAQCYETARRACTGELVCWVADDAESRGDVIGKAARFWDSLNDEKAVLSIQTREYYLTKNNTVGDDFCNMELHSFFGGYPETPRMAPLGMMSRRYLDRLGGIDRRYISGQYENDIVMRVYADGGKVVPFGDKEAYIDINHIGKESIVLGRPATWQDFQNRPFALSYRKDRTVLEQSWCGGAGIRKVRTQRTDAFEPFTDEDILTKSQGAKGMWL